jgi:diacylglycerol kinase (ATP)
MKNQPFARRLAFAIAGLRTAWRTESSFKVHVVAAALVTAALFWWRPSPLWWAAIALVIGVVVAAELFNTALEHLADHLHPEQHPRIKTVKDCAAGAVLIVSIAAFGVAAAFVYEVVLGR